MKRSIGLWQLMGFGSTSLLGTLLHFAYDWLGKPVWVAPFSGINESTWEHMKLLFWPMLAFSILQSFYFRDICGFWRIQLRGILLGMLLIPVIFYTYNGAIGHSPDWFNILIFFIAAAAAYVDQSRELLARKQYRRSPVYALLPLCVLGFCFVFFTFTTPKLPIFKDPLTGGYGIA